MKVYLEKKDCCGCTACKSICPKNAISMKSDDKGFVYPVIDDLLCIECNLCKKVCAFNDSYIRNDLLDKAMVYGAYHKVDEERMTSRSGGAFVAFSKHLLKKDAAIYGAAFDEKFNVLHKRITKNEDIKIFKGSKYVQSNLGNIFLDIKNDLDNNKYVLFSGTSCQVAGLKSYLKNNKNIDKLYTVDIICHGVPSPSIWEKYISFIQKKYKKKIIKADFRDKSFGWGNHKESFFLESEKLSENKITKTFYTELFYKSLSIRECCGRCPYANTKRASDITIGDFWGAEKATPDLTHKGNLEKGISLVIINTTKGKEMFDNSKDELTFMETRLDKAMQPNLCNPTTLSKDYEKFWQDQKNLEFNKLLKKYTSYGLKNRIKNKVNKVMKRKGKNND